MPRVKLTAKNIATLKAKGSRSDYFDAGTNVPGFGLRVAAAGARTWFLFYRDGHGRQKRYKLGTLPPMGLAKAREAARGQLLGVQVDEADPAAAKKARRSAQTFEALAERYVEDYAKPHKRSWREDGRQLRTMVLSKWKGRAAVEIARADVRELLADVAKRRGGITANRLRALLSKLFRWSVSQGYLPANPASDLPKLMREKARERVLSDDEIKALWKRLESAEKDGTIDPAVALWVRLRLLTGQRGSTVARMRWAHLDLDRAVWEIPADYMKAGNLHVVPLSAAVVKLLKARRKVVSEGSTYVHEGARGRRQRLGVIAAIGLEDFQPRDLRRTAASGMARAGASRFIVARVLGHVDRSVTQVYDRYEYLNEKRAALDAWARVVTGILDGKKTRGAVVPFARA